MTEVFDQYFTQVTKEELSNFVNNYGSELHENTCGFITPPSITYNDFTRGKWPDCIVAEVVLNEFLKVYPNYNGQANEYFVLTSAYEAWKEDKNVLAAAKCL